MSQDSIINYRRTADAAAEAMINEGGAIRQPSMRDAEAVFARLNKPCGCRYSLRREWLHSPMTVFWMGFATGLAISLLENRLDEKA